MWRRTFVISSAPSIFVITVRNIAYIFLTYFDDFDFEISSFCDRIKIAYNIIGGFYEIDFI